MMKRTLMSAAAVILLMSSNMAMADQHGDHDGKGRQMKMEKILSQLPQDKAQLVKSTFEKMHADRKANKELHKAHKKEMKALLTAAEFDKSAFIAKAKTMAAKHSQLKIEKAETIANLAAKMTQEERKLLAKIMPKGKGKKGGKRGGKGGKHSGKNAE